MSTKDFSGVKGEGDLVERLGVFGLVVSAGACRYEVRWHRGARERFEQGSPSVFLVRPERVAAARTALGVT